MMKEVLDHVTRSPCNYMSGLDLLSRLLPLPRLDNSHRNARKLWSAHLHSLAPELGRLVREVAGFIDPALVARFRRVTAQLTGLAPPTASCILLAVMRACLAALQSKNSTVSARIMGCLSWLCGRAHLKAVMNTLLLEEGVRTDFCRTLELSITQGSEACQESAIAVLQSLCDPRLSLAAASSPQQSWGQYLADSLPDRATLLEMMTVLLNPFTCELRTNFSIQLLTMRTFIMFAETDFTFSILKLCLNSKNRTLTSFLRKLSDVFDPGNPACIPCIAAATRFLCLLGEEGVGAAGRYPARTRVLTEPELGWVIQYILPQEIIPKSSKDPSRSKCVQIRRV